MKSARAIAILTALCLVPPMGCGPHKGSSTPHGKKPLAITDLVVHGEAIVAMTSMEVLKDSPLTSVLLTGLERQMTDRVPALGKALERTQRAPLDRADAIILTGRSLDESSGVMAVGVSYTEDVDWFDDFVSAFHDGEPEPGTLADLDGGGRLGVLARNTQLSWGTDLTAAVCAVKLSDRIVAFVAAPDAGVCALWAGWVLGRRQGDEDLLAKIEAAPDVPGGKPPLVAYVDGDAFQGLCCAPWGLSEKMYGVDEAWLSLDPGAPAHLSLGVAFSDPKTAQSRRDALATLLDTYAPFLAGMAPGIASVLESIDLVTEGSMLIASVTIDAPYVDALADLLSTML